MPSSTTCTRAYSAPGATGTPSGGTRGLDVGETITVTYEQIISNTAPCATITNTATVKDRPSQSGTTDITGNTLTDTASQALTINCYDLAITKTADAPDVTQNGTITWTIAVTNNGPADMAGPVNTTANPLVITDTFPGGSSVNAPTTSTQTGPAGPCTRSGSTITCTSGLASGATETLLFTQTVKNGATNGAVVNNTASVTDPKTGDSNDSSTGTTTVKNAPTLTLKKTVVGRANAADQFKVSAMHGATTDASATTTGSNASATTAATTLTGGTTYTLTDAMATGSVSVLGQYTKSISCTNTASGSSTTLPSGAGASFTLTPANGDVITCTFSNGPTAPTITFTKSITSRFAASDQFTAQVKNGASVTASATTSGAGTSASTPTTAVTAGTTYTLTEIMASGTSALSDYTSSIACSNSTSGTGTTLPSGTGQSFSVTPVAGDAISCTLTNAAKPHVTLAKTIAGRVVAGDQFTVAIAHGPTTDATAATSGAGTSATTGSQLLVAGTTYTLSESVSGGSSTLSDYVSSVVVHQCERQLEHHAAERQRHVVHADAGRGRQHHLHDHEHREASPHAREVDRLACQRSRPVHRLDQERCEHRGRGHHERQRFGRQHRVERADRRHHLHPDRRDGRRLRLGHRAVRELHLVLPTRTAPRARACPAGAAPRSR